MFSPCVCVTNAGVPCSNAHSRLDRPGSSFILLGGDLEYFSCFGLGAEDMMAQLFVAVQSLSFR